MSRHEAQVTWRRKTEGFAYSEYDRSHEWRFPGGVTVPASAAPEFLGDGARVDPEEAFVAAVSSCHMLTFLAICARKRLVVDRYADHAVGHLEKNHEGKLAVTRVELFPVVAFAGAPPKPSVLASLHELAHKECFIANSVTTEIRLAAEDG